MITENAQNDGSDNTVTFTDTLHSGLKVATPANLLNGCSGGTINATAGSGVVGAYHDTVEQCAKLYNLFVDVTVAAGIYTNTVANITGTRSITTTGLTTSTLLVTNPTRLSKAFSPTSIYTDEVATLTFTITENSVNDGLSNTVKFTVTSSGEWPGRCQPCQCAE